MSDAYDVLADTMRQLIDMTKERDSARAEVREYRNAICYEQTCLGCAEQIDLRATVELPLLARIDDVVAERDRMRRDILRLAEGLEARNTGNTDDGETELLTLLVQDLEALVATKDGAK